MQILFSFASMERKLNVLFIAKNIPIPERQSGNAIIYTIAEKLNSFCNVSFFFPKSRVPWGMHFIKKHKALYKLKDWTYNGFNVNVIPFTQLPGLFSTYWLFYRLPKRAKKEFENQEIDLIHAHYGMPDGYLAYLLHKKYKIPYVVTLRTHDVLYFEKLKKWNPDYKRYIKVIKNASKVTVLNASLKDYFSDFETQIIPHGIDNKYFKNSFSIEKDEVIKIACVANYKPTKHIEWVIDAINQYVGNQKIELYIAGNMVNSPLKFINSNHRIKMLGQLKNQEIQELLRTTDIFALPSQVETFGLVFIEAAAMQNAVIGHYKEGLWDMLEGSFFPNDYESFKQALYELIENKKLRDNYKELAYNSAKNFTWEKVINLYRNLYFDVLN